MALQPSDGRICGLHGANIRSANDMRHGGDESGESISSRFLQYDRLRRLTR